MLLLALLFASTALANPLPGTEDCARGSLYWCQNVKTASLCGALIHCQQNVWNKPQMKSVPCDLCKEIAIVVEQILKDNSTEGEILGYLEKACQLIPDERLSAECKEMVDNYYPILIRIITGELEDPTVVCGAMGLCRSQQAALAEAEEGLQQLLSNEIPQVDLTQQVSPFILNVPQLLFPQEMQETPKTENGDVCKDCATFLASVKEAAKDNSTFISAYTEKLKKQCDVLGPGTAELCKDYVTKYMPTIVQILAPMEQDPKDICAMAGFCDSVKKSSPMLKLQPAKTVAAAKLLPAVELFPASKVTPKTAKPMVRVRNSPECDICEFVMKQLERMLEDNATETAVVHAVETVCSMLPSSLTAQCKDLIETYGKAIIELLVQEADPKMICIVLGLCRDASHTYIPVLDQVRFKTGALCDVCKMAVQYVDRILEENATKAEIEATVKKVCNFLPESAQTECNQLVHEYEPQLVDALLMMLDPDFVCMTVGACTAASQKLLGTEKCSWGPSYWCKNMATATQCSAVEHCKRHVWV
ncbi:prosaposin isoform X2 [Thalassophryne amazonica]|uniref:prosaposin isoform X2 n=1 Tax=Thalassophryne amazonica TaxID=390379 RepID=UPI00147249FB|nr:prosaposin isoform X2 [Thalassophryne amazonica]